MLTNNEKGGTLVEVIVAMLILALLVTGLNTAVVSMIKSNLASKDLSTATSSAYKLFEEFRRTAYSSITTSSDVVNNKYIRAWTVTADSTQKKIDLVIYWPQSTPRHSIAMSTIISHP